MTANATDPQLPLDDEGALLSPKAAEQLADENLDGIVQDAMQETRLQEQEMKA